MSQITAERESHGARGEPQFLDADSILWNWARYVWSGPTVGNMEAYVPWEDNPVAIQIAHARAVEEMHAALPWHERMVIIAEYPQKNVMFAGLKPAERLTRARRWIGQVTGVWLSEPEYRMYLGLFKDCVGRKLL